MPQLPSQLTNKESLQAEVSRLLQLVIPVLDAIHTLPFRNQWLDQSPGQDYIQFIVYTEKWLLWLWQRLQQTNSRYLEYEILSWEGGQKRKQDGLLQHYYRFYEALGSWAQRSPDGFLRKEGWQGYIGFILNNEKHLITQHLQEISTSQKEELELIAQQYLKQMQVIQGLDPYLLCLDLFILVGVFTRKSYFIPQLTFSLLEKDGEETKSPSKNFFLQLKNTEHWADLAGDYLELILRIQSEK